jgi:hypothetical protein
VVLDIASLEYEYGTSMLLVFIHYHLKDFLRTCSVFHKSSLSVGYDSFFMQFRLIKTSPIFVRKLDIVSAGLREGHVNSLKFQVSPGECID